MAETKTILLIGRTGKGKSTLANVITDTDDFKEGKLGISETKEIQTKEFKNDNFDYLIIDNPGIGDTKLPTEKTLDTIAEAVYLVRNGVSRVFFVTDGRFDTNEMATYNLLRAVIFDQDVTKNTTIIRTRFGNFRSPEERKKDITSMIDQGGELAEIIKSCEKKVIHVDNPSLNIAPADDEDSEDEECRKNEISLNGEKREESRKKLLDHLSENCQTNSYKPPKLQALSTEIVEFMKNKKNLEEDLKSISKKKIRKLRNKKINDARVKDKDTKDSKENIGKEPEVTAKQAKEQTDNSQSSHSPDKKNNVEEEIKNLEDERKKLKEEIEEKENIIRQKVFKHIFNNYGDIEKVLGGDTIFISSIIGDDKNDWKKINEKFANKKMILEWKGQGFNYQQTQEWAEGLRGNFDPSGASFYAWLRDNKQLTAEKILSVNIEQLKSEYYYQLQSDNRELEIKLNLKNKQNWQLLNIQHLKESFSNWTSGNEEIDKFIQKCQLEATNHAQVIEWIPFDKFADVKEIGKGGFGSIYSAAWLDGVRKVDSGDNYYREPTSIVALKTLSSSKENNFDFLKEFKINVELFRLQGISLECYGITQNTKTNEYLMVFQYADSGSLYKYLKKNFRELTWQDKLYQLYTIAFGLEAIHEEGVVHCDFHSGNILCTREDCYIADFGLSKKKDEIVLENDIYGVMPYVAPEVMSGQHQFTQAADIYGFGVIMAEMSTGKRPFDGQDFGMKLAVRIVKGERPEFAPGTPDCYIELAKQSMHSDPQKRPSARNVYEKIEGWLEKIESSDENEIKKQFLDADKVIKTLPIVSPSHPDHMYTSKLISTKLISSAIREANSAQINLDINYLTVNCQSTSIPNSNNGNNSLPLILITTSFLLISSLLTYLGFKKKKSFHWAKI